MRKTVNISIGSSLFVIDEQAYARLDEYLASIRLHFAATPDSAEIVSDIEDRIAEELSEALSARKKVIVMEDVEDVIRRMGTVADFEKFDAETSAQADDGAPKTFARIRLYRDGDDKILGGVASGIARYFGIDPVITRLAFGLSLLMGGFGFVLYILLWIILPEAKTAAQKVEMTGGRVTLSAIQSKIEKAMPSDKRRGAIRKVLAFPVMVLGEILRVLKRVLLFVLPLLGRLIGVIIMLGAAFAIAMVTFVLLALLLNPGSPYVGFPLREVVSAVPYLSLMFSAYFLALIPLLFVLLTGLCLVLLRSVFSLPATLGLAGLWFVALVSLGVTGFIVAPQVEAVAERFHEEHFALVEKKLDLNGFDRVILKDHVSVKIMRGDVTSVTVRAPKSSLVSIQSSVEGGALSLMRARPQNDRCMFFCPRVRPVVEIVMPGLAALELEGHAHASVSGFTDDIRYVATDHSAIDADVHAKNAVIDVRSHSFVDLSGSGTALTLNLKDHSVVEAVDFAVTDLTLDLRGHTHATVDARGALSGTVTDHSSLVHQGAPATVNVDVSDRSSIQQGEDRENERW